MPPETGRRGFLAGVLGLGKLGHRGETRSSNNAMVFARCGENGNGWYYWDPKRGYVHCKTEAAAELQRGAAPWQTRWKRGGR
jgi:hypothetical protein